SEDHRPHTVSRTRKRSMDGEISVMPVGQAGGGPIDPATLRASRFMARCTAYNDCCVAVGQPGGSVIITGPMRPCDGKSPAAGARWLQSCRMSVRMDQR